MEFVWHRQSQNFFDLSVISSISGGIKPKIAFWIIPLQIKKLQNCHCYTDEEYCNKLWFKYWILSRYRWDQRQAAFKVLFLKHGLIAMSKSFLAWICPAKYILKRPTDRVEMSQAFSTDPKLSRRERSDLIKLYQTRWHLEVIQGHARRS